MKYPSLAALFAYCLVLLPASFALAVPAEPPALAVLVHAEHGAKRLVEPLQALLEVEMARHYEGPMVERAQLPAILGEMKLSALLGNGQAGAVQAGTVQPGTVQAGAVQAGKVQSAGYLLLVRVGADTVRVTVNGFPKTDIILEKFYAQRFDSESLAVRIAGDALPAIRSVGRDALVPYVAIGSFYVVDRFQRFLNFGRDAELQLRDRMRAATGVRLVERLFPSDLLNEFNLVRAGMTANKTTDYNAPPADLLIYAECAPQPGQELNNPGILLDCTLKVVSPTNLIPARSVTTTCRSNQVGPLIEKASELLLDSVAAARTALERPGARGFSTLEYEAFKQQAFRLMPSPPHEDGMFHRQGSFKTSHQFGKPEELKRALRMLECAALFSGTDTTILDCTAALLMGLAFYGEYPKDTKAALHAAAVELAERAYRIEGNPDTRNFYYFYGLDDTPPYNPAIRQRVARHIVTTREAEAWPLHMVDRATILLVRGEPDWKKRHQTLLEVAGSYEQRPDGPKALMDLMRATFFNENSKDKVERSEANFAASAAFSEQLLARESKLQQAFGHLIAIDLYDQLIREKAMTRHVPDFVKHVRAALALFPGLSATYKRQFHDSNYSVTMGILLRWQIESWTASGFKNELAGLQEQFVVTEMQIGNYSGNLAFILQDLLPSLRERNENATAARLIHELLLHYTVGGSGDYQRMEFIREKHAFMPANEKSRRLRLDQLTAIPFDVRGPEWVARLVPTEHGVFGVRTSPNFQSNGSAFLLDLKADKLVRINHAPAKTVYDLAAVDKYVALATDGGVMLLEPAPWRGRYLTTYNSALPSNTVYLVGNAGNDFDIGVYDRGTSQTVLYRLEPDAGRITATGTKFSALNNWRLKAETGKEPATPQTWYHRTTSMDGKQLTFSTPRYGGATIDASVTRDDGEVLFRYQGYELSFVFDFTVWQGHLVFVTGNGLYISKPGTNELRCILSEPDLLFLSSCLVGDRMVLGTSKGVYTLDAKTFEAVAAR